MASTDQSTDTSALSQNASSPDAAKATGYAPGDGFVSKWSNIFNILSGRMSDAGQAQMRHDQDIRNEGKDCKRCEDDRDYLFKYSMCPDHSKYAGTDFRPLPQVP